MRQHKWHKEIKAYADGVEIEGRWKDPIDGWSKWMTIEFISVFGDNDWEFRIKPQPKEKHFKCNGFCGYYECNEIQARDSNLCKRVIDWKPEPKEPQYLYVYSNVEIDEYVFDRFENDSYNLEYIGKIKLEVDDGTIVTGKQIGRAHV